MAEAQASYSLLDEPWIPCLLSDGTVQEFGVKQIFAEASNVRDIVGELPTQTFAIARLLLAVLHQALGEDLEMKSDWGRVWREGLPVEAVHDYLESHRDRFDLLHPETPFYQVVGLHTAKNEVKGIAALLLDVPSNFRLFTGRAGDSLDELSLAEAARWLIHAHAYDVSGIHSGMVGDSRVKGGKGYGIGTGIAGELGGVLVEGNNLAETLILNLVPRRGDRAHLDVPPWEREPDTAAARLDESVRGTVDLLTWQSRRVRLVHDGARVTGCLVGNGDKISVQNLHHVEPMTAWRFSKPQTQKNKGVPVFMPRTHQPDRAFWRGISGLTVQRTASGSASGPPSGYPPPVLSWLVELQGDGFIDRAQLIAPRAIGVEYGTQSSVVTNVVDDRLLAPLAVFDAERHPRLSSCARAAVDAADGAVRELGKFAGNLALAAGGEADGPAARAREEGFASLDLPFRAWLRNLEGVQTEDPENSLNAWKDQVGQIIRRIGRALRDAAGEIAWQGRLVRRLNGEQRITAPIAEIWFESGLKRALTKLDADSVPEGDSEKSEKEDTDD